MPDIVNWYLESLATFWGSAFRIGLPQIILLVLLVCWLRRRCCEKSRGRCGRGWARDGGDGRGCCPKSSGCGCTCGCCCCQSGDPHEEAHAAADADAS